MAHTGPQHIMTKILQLEKIEVRLLTPLRANIWERRTDRHRTAFRAIAHVRVGAKWQGCDNSSLYRWREAVEYEHLVCYG